MSLRIAWLTTGRGPGSYGALEYTLGAIDRGLAVEIAVLFINRARGEAEPTDRLIGMAESRGIPVEMLSSVTFRKKRGGKVSKPGEPLQPWRLEYDAAVANLLGRHRFELGVMFGYMLIATEPLYGVFQFINDHPALPDGPVGTYQEVIAELIRTRATESGCMMNVVTGEVDRGAPISFCRFPIYDDANRRLWEDATTLPVDLKQLQDTALFQDIRARGVRRERPFLVATLRCIAGGRIVIPPMTPIDLSNDIEKEVASPAYGR